MFNYTSLYFIEILILTVAIICEIILLRKKEKKELIMYMALTLLVFLVIFFMTLAIEKPRMELNGVKDLQVNSSKEINPPKTYWHMKDVTSKVKVIGEVDSSKIGEYDVEFEFDTWFFPYKENYKIKVVDSMAPEITLEGETEYKISYAKEYEEPGYKAIDLYDGDLSEKVEITKQEKNENEYDIKYTVSDSNGNKAEKIRRVILIDDVPPELTLNGNTHLYLHLDEAYEELGAKAIDEKDGDLSGNIVINGSVNMTEEGTYTIVYKVSDSKENSVEKKRIITVSAPNTVIAQDGTLGKKGVVYLTFDDGPTLSSTPKILDILQKKDVKATFFVLNYGEAEEELIKREFDEGHTIAIHGYSHKYGDIYTSEEAYMNNIKKLQDKIEKTTGYKSTITRFPGGSSNTVSRKYRIGIMTTLCKKIVDEGYSYFDWNVDSDDAGKARNSDDVYNNVTKRLSKDRANVVLMHDYANNYKTIDALEKIIDFGLENGYKFEVIAPDTPMVTHTPNN